MFQLMTYGWRPNSAILKHSLLSMQKLHLLGFNLESFSWLWNFSLWSMERTRKVDLTFRMDKAYFDNAQQGWGVNSKNCTTHEFWTCIRKGKIKSEYGRGNFNLGILVGLPNTWSDGVEICVVYSLHCSHKVTGAVYFSSTLSQTWTKNLVRK